MGGNSVAVLVTRLCFIGPKYISRDNLAVAMDTFSGCLQALQKMEMLESVKTYCGDSLGALVALACVLGKCPRNLPSVEREFNIWDLIWSGISWTRDEIEKEYTSTEVYFALQELVKDAFGNADATFADLYSHDKFVHNFECAALCLDTGRVVVMNYTNTPSVRLVDAVCAACGLPGLSRPVSISELGLMCCVPPWRSSYSACKQSLVVQMKSVRKNKRFHHYEWIQGLFSSYDDSVLDRSRLLVLDPTNLDAETSLNKAYLDTFCFVRNM